MATSVVLAAEDRASVDDTTRRALFRLVLLHRLIEQRIMTLYRQGRIPGSVYTGRGQEAVGAASGSALDADDVCAPLNRELGCHLARGVTIAQVFRNYLGRADGPTAGRDGNMHFGVPERGVFPLVSMLGDLVPVTVGAALAFKRPGQPRVALTFLGDGAYNTGDTHEGLNLAAVFGVPAVFVLQSNTIAYSTPTQRAMRNPNLSERIQGGYAIPCQRVDGSDAVTVFEAVRDACAKARSGDGPQAVEALSLRLDGHAAHDDARYMPRELLDDYQTRRDPVERLAERLAQDGVDASEIEAIRHRCADEVSSGLAEAESSPRPDPRTLTTGVYADPV